MIPASMDYGLDVVDFKLYNFNNLKINSNGEHAHSITVNKNGSHIHNININSTGSGSPHENRPPYYVLAYIMKTGIIDTGINIQDLL